MFLYSIDGQRRPKIIKNYISLSQKNKKEDSAGKALFFFCECFDNIKSIKEGKEKESRCGM